MMKSLKMAKGELVLRICAVVLLVVGACVVGTDKQTKLVFGFVRATAIYKDVEALKVLIWVDSVAAAYNLLQLTRFCNSPLFKIQSRRSYATLVWLSFLCDQVVAYVVFAANVASGEVGILAITGFKGFQWMKLCNRFTRFCIQFGGGIVSGALAFLAMVLICTISAFNLFRLYSPKHFMVSKLPSTTT